MKNGNEDETGWDTLASQLGLEPAPSRPPSPPPIEQKKPEQPARVVEPIVREEVVEIIPAHITEIEMKVTSVAEDVEAPLFGEGIVEDAVDVLDDEAPEEMEGAGDEDKSEGEGKGRRRRRRRRRKKGGTEAVAAEGTASAAIAPIAEIEETPEANVLAFPIADDEEAAAFESGTDSVESISAELEGDEDEIEEIIPEIAIVEEEEESTEPLPEWKVTAWTELIATLYRPQDR
jgi:hypothetical protein